AAERSDHASDRTATADVPAPAPGGDRVLRRIVEARVVEVADSHHLRVRDVGVPVGHGSPAGAPGVEVVAGKTEGRWNPDGTEMGRGADLSATQSRSASTQPPSS